jgi:hypothetical protein
MSPKSPRTLITAAVAAVLALAASLSLEATAAYANTGTITANGPTVTATISTANTPATFTFSGTSGEVVTASTFGGTFASGCDVDLEILAPSGATVASAGCVGVSGFIGETPLPGAGTYTLELAPADGDLGSVTLALSANAANAAITANGPATTFTASHTGQGRDYTFTGTAGEVVTFSTSAGTFPNPCDLNMQLTDPVGNVLGSAACTAVSGFIGQTTLPSAGPYTIGLIPSGTDPGTNTGALTLNLSSDPANAKITANGAAVTFTASHTGQGRDYTFKGTAGEVVTVSTSAGTFPNACDLNIQLTDPSGAVLGSAACVAVSGFIGEMPLPGAGTYTIELIPSGTDPGTNTGHLTLNLSSDPANAAITANGAAATFTASHTGQGQDFTFTGAAGEVVTVSTSAGTFPNACDLNIQIVSPTGFVLGSAACTAVSGFIGETPLPGAGTYTVELIPSGTDPGTNTGSLTLNLSADPANSTITANGSPVTFTAAHTGQGENYTFSGTAGEVVSLTTSAGSFPNACDLNVQIVSPSGSDVASAACVAQSGTISDATLPGTGTYTVEVIPSGTNPGSNTGSLQLALTSGSGGPRHGPRPTR